MRDSMDLAGLALFFLLLGALLFGVTWKGKHYEIRCGEERGVELREERVP